jgi:dTDP-glucose 4,6-dehydratase
MKARSPRVLICGGAGFIGSHFTEAVCGRYPASPVTVLDNLSFAGVLANLHSLRRRPYFRFVKGDINDAGTVRRLLKETDLLVNFAAETHVDRSLLSAGTFLKTGVMGTFNLVEEARLLGRVRRLLLMSTDEVYGPILSGAAGEGAPLNPSSPYSAAKAGGDLLALSYARSFKLPVTIPRACNVFGPRQFPEKFIPVFATNAILRLPLPLYGDGRQEREWLYVSDVVRALLLLLKRGDTGRIYNIGSGVWKRNILVAKSILKRLGRPESLIRFVPDRPGHDRRYAVRDDAIRRLGWRPRVRFTDGLAMTADWYRNNTPWWMPLRRRSAAYFRAQYGGKLFKPGGK